MQSNPAAAELYASVLQQQCWHYPFPLTFDVQITSRKWMFIQVSHITMCPLYVSPVFSSTSCDTHANECAAVC